MGRPAVADVVVLSRRLAWSRNQFCTIPCGPCTPIERTIRIVSYCRARKTSASRAGHQEMIRLLPRLSAPNLADVWTHIQTAEQSLASAAASAPFLGRYRYWPPGTGMRRHASKYWPRVPLLLEPIPVRHISPKAANLRSAQYFFVKFFGIPQPPRDTPLEPEEPSMLRLQGVLGAEPCGRTSKQEVPIRTSPPRTYN